MYVLGNMSEKGGRLDRILHGLNGPFDYLVIIGIVDPGQTTPLGRV